MKEFPLRVCTICQAAERVLLYEQRFHSLPSGSPCEGYDVVACKGCGFTFADRIPDVAAFNAYYSHSSRSENAYRGGGDTEFEKEHFRATCEFVSSHFDNKELAILDLGCGRGGLLAELKRVGFNNVRGLDPATGCARIVDELYGIEVITGSILDNNLPSQSIDLAALVSVVEHIPNLDDALCAVAALVKTGGHLLIDVPDAASFHLEDDAPFQQFSIEHINYFSLISLSNLITKFGFTLDGHISVAHQMSATTVMPTIIALFRKQASDKKPTFDTESEPALRQYITNCLAEEERIASILERLAASGNRIVVWGTGTHTLHLLETSPLSRCNIIAYADSNPNVQGKQIGNLPIVSPNALKDYSEPLLISSRVFQDDIVRQIRDELKLDNELVLLYPSKAAANPR